MSRDYLPASDAQFNLWLKNFSAQLGDRGAVLGFKPEELAAFTAAAQRWTLAIEAQRTAEAGARSATADKRDARRAMLAMVRPFVRRVQANPATTDSIRGAMQLTASETGRTEVMATAVDQTPQLLLDFGTRGQITVHFGPNPGNENRNGLPAGAIGAVVQVRSGAANDETASWQWLDNPSSSPYVHLVQPSAVKVLAYRCAYLYRRGRKGPWSAPAEAAVTP